MHIDFPPEPPLPAPSFGEDTFVAIDLGELHDPSAAVVLVRSGMPPVYSVTDIKRWPLRTTPNGIVTDTVKLLSKGVLAAPVTVCLDASGVGRGHLHLFRQALPTLRNAGRLLAVTITGGSSEHWDDNSTTFHVAKKNLVSCLQCNFGMNSLRIAKDLALSASLRAELDTFTAKINPTSANISYEAWRQSDSDDIVLALSLAVWAAERTGRPFSTGVPIKLTSGHLEEPSRRQGALGYGKGEEQRWLDW
jgi:hypothetical protein